jgi:hypothetical protein
MCGKEYRATGDFKERKQIYCSVVCFRKNWAETIRPRMKNNPGFKGKLNYNWKGDKVGYHGIHRWIAKEKGKPQKCEGCGSTTKRKYEWANKDHLYKRIKEDWVRLCTSCHRLHDKKL